MEQKFFNFVELRQKVTKKVIKKQKNRTLN